VTRDVSAGILEIRRTYGGSDRAAPSFNATQYVRHASVEDPLDLGPLPDGDVFLDGVIGAEAGSQSLFIRFELPEPARLGARVMPGNRYQSQYIELHLSTPSGQQLLEESIRFAPLPPAVQESPYITITITDGYAEAGYWVEGYAVFDGGVRQTINNPQRSSEQLPEFLPSGEVLAAGTYLAVLSNSQWSSLPFTLHLGTRQPRLLGGEITLDLEVDGRSSMLRAGGVADLPLELNGQLARNTQLAGVSDLSLEPVATMTRVSPFQV
jgi:hypothetical protein